MVVRIPKMVDSKGITMSACPCPAANHAHAMREEILALYPHWKVTTHGFFYMGSRERSQPIWSKYQLLSVVVPVPPGNDGMSSFAWLLMDRPELQRYVRCLCDDMARN